MRNTVSIINPELRAVELLQSTPAFFEKAFEAAHNADEPLRKVVTYEQCQDASKELSTILEKFPYLHNLIIEFGALPERRQILQAAILLYVKAGDHKRKYSNEKRYEHSLRVANDALFVVDGVITDPKRRTAIVKKAILHDGIEDYGMEVEQIIDIFKGDIALSVERMTTPNTEILAKTYPAITSKFVPAEKMESESPESYLDDLQKGNPAAYEELKSQLKLHFKCEEARAFELDELIIKSIDNSDSLRSYVKDILEKIIRIYHSANLGAPVEKLEGGYILFPSAKADRNINDRTIYQQNALSPRYRDVAARNNDQDIKTGPHGYLLMEQRCNWLFNTYKKQFSNLVINAIQRSNFLRAGFGMLATAASATRDLFSRLSNRLSRYQATLS